MDRKKYYDLENPRDIQEVMDLIENEDLSDIELGVGSDEEDIQEYDVVPISRPGPDILTRHEAQLLERNVRDEENGTWMDQKKRREENTINSVEEDDMDAIGEASQQRQRGGRNKKRTVKWKKTSFRKENIEWTPLSPDTNFTEPQYPEEYFLRYITREVFAKMAGYTNIYDLQQGKSFRSTTTSEIMVLFALHIMIGCLDKFPRIRMYWEKFFGIGIFSENMSRDRFFQLRSCLYLVNNLEKPENCVDKLYKEELCVDEQIVPFTGTSAIKQYVKGKPCPWGLKLFILCGKSGYAYDFIFYPGKTTGLNGNNLKKYGQGASVVLHLTEKIGIEKGHRLYYDDYFSSYDLLTILKDEQIYSAGTIRSNRFFKPPLMTDRKNRGFSEETVDEKENVVVVK
ncbi:hypothetical protein JTB14_026898 [Gonioctena quinquepunctata]|nr:hypothetical protein JTB14_026898 [Gonioctena quinquepunctata]